MFHSKPIVRLHLVILAISLLCCTTADKSKPADTDFERTPANRFSLHTNMNCEKSDLSKQFDITINFDRYSDTTEFYDSDIVRVYLKDKKTKVVFDSISLRSIYYYDDPFTKCDSLISYSTGINTEKEIIDNNFGDLIIADLNFDKKDDIAIMNDYGGNSGPYYSYFIQNKERKLVLDNYLTDSVSFFPSVIDKSKNNITISAVAGAYRVGVDTYHFDNITKKWKHASHKINPPIEHASEQEVPSACKFYYDNSLKENIYTEVTQPASFPGGEIEKQRFLIKHLRYPNVIDSGEIQSSFNISLIVEANGSLSHFTINGNSQKSRLTSVELAVLSMLNQMPKWIPAECGERKVAARVNFPLFIHPETN
jgi:hypothetical protein